MLVVPLSIKKRRRPIVAVSPVSHLKPNHQSAGMISITCSCCSVSGMFSLGLAGSCSTVACWPPANFRYQHDLTVRQFQGVMVEIGLVLIDLPKPSYLVRESSVSETIGALAFRTFFKGKLRAW